LPGTAVGPPCDCSIWGGAGDRRPTPDPIHAGIHRHTLWNRPEFAVKSWRYYCAEEVEPGVVPTCPLRGAGPRPPICPACRPPSGTCASFDPLPATRASRMRNSSSRPACRPKLHLYAGTFTAPGLITDAAITKRMSAENPVTQPAAAISDRRSSRDDAVRAVWAHAPRRCGRRSGGPRVRG